MPNLSSALQQAYQALGKIGQAERTGISNVIGGVKALVNPATRQDYLAGVQSTLQGAGILNKPKTQRSNVPPQLRGVMMAATKGFSPAARERASRVKINYTPEYGDAYLPMGAQKVFGKVSKGAAGTYNALQNPSGVITIGTKYAQDPEILRHELIHSMDANTNYGIPMLPDKGEIYSEQDFQRAAEADRDFANRLSVIMQYLSGLGVIDSRGLYLRLNQKDQGYINERISNPIYNPDSRTKDVEGAAYMGTTGAEYQYPTYVPMTMMGMRE